MSNAKILDLDKLIPDKRVIRLAGEDIDVSSIPSRVTLEIAEKSDVLLSGDAESFPLVFDMIIKIMKPSKQDITQDWLVDNTNMNQLMALMEFVLEPLNEKANEGQEKNAQAPAVNKNQ